MNALAFQTFCSWRSSSCVAPYVAVIPAGNNHASGVPYPSTTVKFTYPTIQIAGANLPDGTYAMHAGCGNSNGVNGCDTFCKNLGLTITPGWDVACGSGYPSSVTTATGTGSVTCLYRSSSSTAATGYTGYGSATSCGNPMYDCVCST